MSESSAVDVLLRAAQAMREENSTTGIEGLTGKTLHALADWLDEVARWTAMSPPNPPGGGRRALSVSESAWAAMYPRALAAARTYLGEGPAWE